MSLFAADDSLIAKRNASIKMCMNRARFRFGTSTGADSRIRTLGLLRVVALAVRCNRPLCQVRGYIKSRGKKQTSQPRCKNSSRRNSFCFYKFKFIEKGANRQPYLLLEHTDPHFSVFMVPVSGVEPLPSGFSDRCCRPQVS